MFIRSKIQFFESKSQHQQKWIKKKKSCLSDQRYNFLKANHNGTWSAVRFFTLFIRSKIQFFESKSQHQNQVLDSQSVVYQIKDTIFWKQITTAYKGALYLLELFIRSKIQFFESKSQLGCTNNAWMLCCLSDQRYNFLKANHNTFPGATDYSALFIRSKIQFFESKSQPGQPLFEVVMCCLSDQRYNFLKANHNRCRAQYLTVLVVYQIKDTIFWKQITTGTQGCRGSDLLFIKSKIQFFESYSQ